MSKNFKDEIARNVKKIIIGMSENTGKCPFLLCDEIELLDEEIKEEVKREEEE